jgi:hypothetical protein
MLQFDGYDGNQIPLSALGNNHARRPALIKHHINPSEEAQLSKDLQLWGGGFQNLRQNNIKAAERLQPTSTL